MATSDAVPRYRCPDHGVNVHRCCNFSVPLARSVGSHEPRRMTGRCANGFERDGGKLWHAVAGDVTGWGKAACGAKPGDRSNGWSESKGERVTCPRCLRIIAQSEDHQARSGAAAPTGEPPPLPKDVDDAIHALTEAHRASERNDSRSTMVACDDAYCALVERIRNALAAARASPGETPAAIEAEEERHG